jgi:competence protein ComEA
MHTTIKSLLAAVLFAVASFGAFAAQPVNINTASAKELADALKGVGPAKAEAIIAWREANGPFQSVEQLAEVRGIGLRTVELNRDVITLGNEADAPTTPAKPVTAGAPR